MPIPHDLLDGYRRFRAERFAAESARYRALAAGQQPKTMVIGCADSRVDPATIFAAGPGELFVVRNVAALVPPCQDDSTYHGTSAALEFAVSVLEVERVVVMGHGLCGGVAAALADAENRPIGQFIKPWVDQLAAVRNDLLEQMAGAPEAARQLALERLAVRQSLANLMTFPFVTAAAERRNLRLEGAWFSIAEGRLHWLDPATGQFSTVKE